VSLLTGLAVWGLMTLLTDRPLIWAVIAGALVFVLVFGEGAYRMWNEADEDATEKAEALEAAQAKIKELQASRPGGPQLTMVGNYIGDGATAVSITNHPPHPPEGPR